LEFMLGRQIDDVGCRFPHEPGLEQESGQRCLVRLVNDFGR
jgi:hypothetical protein